MLKKLLSVLVIGATLVCLHSANTSAQIGVQPFRTPAWQIAVQTNDYKFPDGAGVNWSYIKLGGNPTDLNAQAVFNWIDSNWVNVIGASLNTNSWTNLFPTAATVQATFNFIDIYFRTNWLTPMQASSMFLSVTSKFIYDSVSQVSNIDLATNAVSIDKVEPNYMKMPRIARYISGAHSNSGVGSGSSQVTIDGSSSAPNFSSNSQFLTVYGYIRDTGYPTLPAPYTVVNMSLWVSNAASGDTTFMQKMDEPMQYLYNTGVTATLNMAVPANWVYPIAASSYWYIVATAVNSNAQITSIWYTLWQKTLTDGSQP